MDLDFYVRVRTCKNRVTGKQLLLMIPIHVAVLFQARTFLRIHSQQGQYHRENKYRKKCETTTN